MEIIQLDTEIQDGMYMDIHSIEFEYDPTEFKGQVERALKIIKENKDILTAVSLQGFNNKAIQATKHFNSEVEDEEKTEDVDSRIDTEIIKVSEYGVKYRGYNKWTNDFLEVCLNKLV